MAYDSYANLAFNNPVFAGFKELKDKCYIKEIGDVYPMLVNGKIVRTEREWKMKYR